MPKVALDFTGTEGRKGARRYKPGDYAVQVIEAKLGKSSQKKTKHIAITYRFLDGTYKGKQIIQFCNLVKQSLWVLRNAMEGMGMKVPAKRANVDLARFKGKKLAITIADDTYGDKGVRSKVVDTFPLSDLEEIEDEEVDVMDEEEEEDLDEEDEDDEDEEEDEEDIEELDI